MQDAGVSKSGYYAWRQAALQEEPEDALLTEKIREIHSRSRETYGYPRVHAELRARLRCGRRRVARLMRAPGLQGCMRGKKRSTTRRDPRAAPAPDLLGRDFVAAQPKQGLAGGHHLRTDAGRLPVSGLHPGHPFSKGRRVGDGHPHEDGARGRRPGDGGLEAQAIRGLVHHSDRGTQYTAISFGRRLEEAGIVPSMGRTGTALDNAMAESFIATLKTELVHRRRFPDREVARSAIFEYLEGFYDRAC